MFHQQRTVDDWVRGSDRTGVIHTGNLDENATPLAACFKIFATPDGRNDWMLGVVGQWRLVSQYSTRLCFWHSLSPTGEIC
jgi:hypothetical protein